MTLYLICYYIVTIVFSSIHWFFSINMSEFNAEQCLSKHCNKLCIVRTAVFCYYCEWMLWIKYVQKQCFFITDAVNECYKWCVMHRSHWVIYLFILSDFYNIFTFFFTFFICFAYWALNMYINFHFLTLQINNDFWIL